MMKRARTILLTTQMISTGTGALLAPIWAIYVEKIGGDILDAAGAYAIWAVVYGLFVMVVGKFTDTVEQKKHFIVVGFLISAVGFFCYLLVRNPWQLFFVEALLGVALALMTPAHDALYTKYLDHGKAAMEWGMWEGIYYLTEGGGCASRRHPCKIYGVSGDFYPHGNSLIFYSGVFVIASAAGFIAGSDCCMLFLQDKK